MATDFRTNVSSLFTGYAGFFTLLTIRLNMRVKSLEIGIWFQELKWNESYFNQIF